MFKLYNTQKEITTHIAKFLQNSIPNIRKTQLKIIPFIIFGMINSNSCVASSIASNLKDDFSLVKLDSVNKRIRRFLTINFLMHILFITILLKPLFLLIKKSIMIKEFIFVLIILILMKITLFI